MLLIADSGATKTDWRFISKEGEITAFSTAGLSPMFNSKVEIIYEIEKKFPKKIKQVLKKNVSSILFYGTSCSTKEKIHLIYSAIHKVFPKAKIRINSDMLAAVRTLYGTKKGIVCILGTGSNSCYYDGKKIIKTIGGLTFILGDEGSGAHLGKEFIKAWLNNELPPAIHKKFQTQYRLTKAKVFHALYKEKNPSRFLASFSIFILQHIENIFVEGLVCRCFEEFFDKTICKYDNYQNLRVGFTGSIANNFKKQLLTIAKEKHVFIKKIISKPIDELVNFHLSK